MTNIMLKSDIKNYRLLILLIIMCSVYPLSIFAEAGFKVFQTNQPAQALIPMIEPLYSEQAKITAKNNSLIVKAPPHVLKEITQLLKELDKPLLNLLIEVSSSLEADDHYQQNSIEGRVKTSDSTVISSRAPDKEQPNISVRYAKDGSVIKTTHTRRRSSHSNPDTFRIRALEGTWAFIQTGKKVPYYSSSYPQRGYYPPRQVTTELVDVSSGFEVLPMLNGERVTLKVRPKNQSLDRQYTDRINSRSMDTTVTGELGQWIYLGGAINKINEQNSAVFHSSKRYSELDSNYRIKVNIIQDNVD